MGCRELVDLSYVWWSTSVLAYNEKEEKVGELVFKWSYDDSGSRRNVTIEWLEVRSDYRRQGVASALLEEFLRMLPPTTLWVQLNTGLLVEKDNAWGLYLKAGFKEMCYQPDYYEDGVGTRFMAKRLRK